jgi:hypothetical protein
MSIRPCAIVFAALLLARNASWVFAAADTQPSSAPSAPLLLDDDDDVVKPTPPVTPIPNQSSTRYFIGLLDHRSSYGLDFFPDPFLGPELDSERQVEADYLHSEKTGRRADEIDAGIQWNVVGQLNVAGEFGWNSEHQTNIIGADQSPDTEEESGTGFESVDLAIYHPLFQFVSHDNQFDYTAVARLDLGIPTRTPVSGTDVQLTPYLGHVLRIGNHVSIEAWTASQFTIAPNQTSQFIYGALLGYQIPHEQCPLPLTERITPLLELDGQTPFSGNAQDTLFTVVGVNINFKSTGEFQPSIQFGVQLPLDQGARDQLQWGVLAEFLFDL